MKDIKALIASPAMGEQFARALPKHLPAERFARVAITALTRTPKLAECTQASLMKCLLDLSAMGLEPDGRKAHLIPYRNKKNNTVICTLIIDYKGLVDLARRSGEISYIHADVVCENDEFAYSYGSGAHLKHTPAGINRGKVLHAYSFVKLKDGAEDFVVMNRDEIEAIRKRSKASNNGPWVTDWNEMAKKTVFRRHSKWLPVSSEFQEAIDKDYDVSEDIAGHAELPDIPMPTAKKEIEVKPEEPKPEKPAAKAKPAPAAPGPVQGGPCINGKQISNLEKLAKQASINLLERIGAEGFERVEDLPVSMYALIAGEFAKIIDEEAGR
jgi:recombination protein RecT